MIVPNAACAIIAADKLTAYLLHISHKRGSAKARLLLSLGYRSDANVRATKSSQPSAIAPSSQDRNCLYDACKSDHVLRLSRRRSAAMACVSEHSALCADPSAVSMSDSAIVIPAIPKAPGQTTSNKVSLTDMEQVTATHDGLDSIDSSS